MTEQGYNRADNFEEAVGGRWQPSQSGNLAGRPKHSVTALLKATDEKDAEAIAETVRKRAKAGDSAYTNIYLDRTDGKVPDIKLIKGMIVSITGDGMAKLSQQILDAETLLLDGDDDANLET